MDYNDELDTLEAIFEDELTVARGENEANLIIRFKPTAAKDPLTASYFLAQLSVLLKVNIEKEYPKSKPIINICEPRGITEQDVLELDVSLKSILDANINCPVLFDIFSTVQTFLDGYKVANVPCPICLCTFNNDDIVQATVCHHHFHNYCIAKCVQTQRENFVEILEHAKKDVVKPTFMSICPVCRCELPELLHLDMEGESTPTLPQTPLETDKCLEVWRDKQKQMSRVYDKQLRQGGIIDANMEQRKMLITEDTRILLPSTAALSICDDGEMGEKDKDETRDKYRLAGARPKVPRKGCRAHPEPSQNVRYRNHRTNQTPQIPKIDNISKDQPQEK